MYIRHYQYRESHMLLVPRVHQLVLVRTMYPYGSRLHTSVRIHVTYSVSYSIRSVNIRRTY